MKPKITHQYMLFQFDDEHKTQVTFIMMDISKAWWKGTVQTEQETLYEFITNKTPTAEMAQTFYDYVYRIGES